MTTLKVEDSLLQGLRHLSQHSLVYTIGSILTQGIAFLLIPVFTRFLSPQDYGILGVADLVRTFLMQVYFTALAGVVVRFYFDLENEMARKRFYGTSWLFLALQGCIVVVVLEGVGPRLFDILFRNFPYRPLGQYVIWGGIIGVISSGIPLNLFRAREQSGRYVAFSIGSFFLKTAFILYFIILKGEGALGSIRGQLYGTVLIAVPLLAFVWRNIELTWSWNDLRKIAVFGLPLVPHAVASWGLNLSDRVILNHYVSLSNLGLYTFAYQFGLVVAMVVSSINNAWSPLLLASVDRPGGRDSISRLATYVWGFMFLIGLGMSLLAPPIIRIAADSAFHSSADAVPWIVLGYVAQGLYIIPANVLLYRKETRYMALATVSGVVANIVLNLLLIPRFGIMAAAINTFVAYFVSLLIALVRASRTRIVSYEELRILKILVVCFIVYAIGVSVEMSSPYLEFLVRGLAILVGMPLGLWFVRFYTEQEIAMVNRATKMLVGRVC